MSRQISLLIVGLDFQVAKKIAPPNVDMDKMGPVIQSHMDLLDQVPNLYKRIFFLDDTAPAESDKSIEAYKKIVREGPPHGGHWDGQLIGGGLKNGAPMVPVLEDVINSTAASSNGKTKSLFVSNGMDQWEAVKRGFPELGMGEKPEVEGH